jgi:hypothetical protein
MKTKITLLLAMMLTSVASFSQGRIKEIGLTLSNLQDFGFSYKVGSSTALWRFNSLFFNGDQYDYGDYYNAESTQKNFGVGADIGKEFRKNLTDEFQLRYGVDFSFSYARGKTEYINFEIPDNNQVTEIQTYSPGIALVLGANYIFHEKLIFGAEFKPGISYRTGKEIRNYANPDIEDIEREISGYNFSGSLSSIILTLAYRITK